MSEKKNMVLVPVNFSEYAENGAVYALQIAAGIDADIMLLNVYYNPVLSIPASLEPYSYMTGIGSDLRKIEEETQLSLEVVKQMLESQIEKQKYGNIKVRYDMIQGFAGESILAYAEEYNPNVIVMGTPGKKPEGITRFGKTTTKVLENAKVPVIAVPLGYDAYRFKKPQKVIYLTNLDKTDYFAIDRLAGFANFFNAKIICIHTSEIESDEKEEAKMKEIKEYISGQLGVTNLECGILESANPQSGLEKFIKERGADVLAFSTQKRSVFLNFFNSGPIHQFLYQTDIPLLVYHAK